VNIEARREEDGKLLSNEGKVDRHSSEVVGPLVRLPDAKLLLWRLLAGCCSGGRLLLPTRVLPCPSHPSYPSSSTLRRRLPRSTRSRQPLLLLLLLLLLLPQLARCPSCAHRPLSELLLSMLLRLTRHPRSPLLCRHSWPLPPPTPCRTSLHWSAACDHRLCTALPSCLLPQWQRVSKRNILSRRPSSSSSTHCPLLPQRGGLLLLLLLLPLDNRRPRRPLWRRQPWRARLPSSCAGRNTPHRIRHHLGTPMCGNA